jgi:hypothetical protein
MQRGFAIFFDVAIFQKQATEGLNVFAARQANRSGF